MNPLIPICAAAAIMLTRGTAAAAPDAPHYAITNEVRMTRPMMKGVELYAWTNAGGDWNYALLTGTNVRKSRSTIRSPAHAITSLDQLKNRLSVLAEGEQVVWTGDGPRPPEDIQKQVRAVCIKLNIELR
jgi:hypothetical protein